MEYVWPRWPPDDERARQALAVAVQAGRWAISGPPSALPSFLDAAAVEVARMAGRRFAVLTSSGSSAIVLALQSLGVGRGSRVLMPATTWVGCATAALRVGAAPVFIDADALSPGAAGGLDEKRLGPIDAALAVHLYASQADISALRASLPDVPVIEDCAHANGAVSADGRPLGSFGDLAVFSFQATKVLPAGEGGAVVTDDAGTAQRLFALASDSRRPVREPALDALNRLEPAGLSHGANHAMSEFAAAVLWAQLLRFPELAQRRSEGLRFLAAHLDGVHGELIFDEASAASGGFYGVLFLPNRPWPRGATHALNDVQGDCGARLDEVYPPVPCSPLYRPWTVPTYARTPYSADNVAEEPEHRFPTSTRWQRDALVLPHWLFLADKPPLRALARALGWAASPSRAPRCTPKTKTLIVPEVCVVLVTAGRRDTLIESLRSVERQTYAGPCSVLVLCDDQDGSTERVTGLLTAADLPARLPVRTVTLTLGPGTGDVNAFSRVARLRNTALGYVDAPLVAFLDDDNAWDPAHLSSLVRLMRESRALATHSWRRLLTPRGQPYVPDTFPWLPDPEAAAARFAHLTDAGVFQLGSDIVRDRASVPVDGGDYGMVDVGEWLFDRRLFDLLRFDTHWTPHQIDHNVGEDDKLLQRLRDLLIPVHCTERATLRYRLGGLSNTFGQGPARPPRRAVDKAEV